MINLFNKETPKKNYMIVLIVSILVIAFALYVRAIYLKNKDNIRDKSIFERENSVVSSINIDDLEFVVSESNDIVLYMSYNGNQDIKNMERKLYREIVRNDYVDKVLYLNVSELKEDNKYISKLKEKMPNIKGDISDAPIMVYIKDGEAIEAVNSEFKMIDYSVLEKLFEKYEISQ
jgi:hypothetical protein